MGWLLIGDVKDQLRMDATDVDDDALIGRCIGSATLKMQQARPDRWVYTYPDPATFPPGPPDRRFVPDDEVYQTAVMLAARLVRRRNSSAGLETMGDTVVYVSRWDPDIQQGMRTGAYAWPAVG
jgi:hypothetical protein